MVTATLKRKLSEISRCGSMKKRMVKKMDVGQAIMQGDVYLIRVADDWPRGDQIGEKSVQIALGSSNGARHMATGPVQAFKGKQLPNGFTAPQGVDSAELLGPVVVASRPWTLTHPEHPHHALPAGTYQVTYQVDLMTMRRVQD